VAGVQKALQMTKQATEPRQDRVTVTDDRGRSVVVELRGDVFYIKEKMFLYFDINDLIEVAKNEKK